MPISWKSRRNEFLEPYKLLRLNYDGRENMNRSIMNKQIAKIWEKDLRFFSGVMENENVAYTYSGYYLAFEKKGNPAISNNLDETRGLYPKWNKLGRERQKLNDFTYVWNLKFSNALKKKRERE